MKQTMSHFKSILLSMMLVLTSGVALAGSGSIMDWFKSGEKILYQQCVGELKKILRSPSSYKFIEYHVSEKIPTIDDCKATKKYQDAVKDTQKKWVTVYGDSERNRLYDEVHQDTLEFETTMCNRIVSDKTIWTNIFIKYEATNSFNASLVGIAECRNTRWGGPEGYSLKRELIKFGGVKLIYPEQKYQD